ncbi:AAA family ATPase [Streptomyces sp. NPDC018584]|uniref:AAA family ATPase n=1 Tax=unclassified Streptomyces TaxID=2593676 RepID=UPI0037B083A2
MRLCRIAGLGGDNFPASRGLVTSGLLHQRQLRGLVHENFQVGVARRRQQSCFGSWRWCAVVRARGQAGADPAGGCRGGGCGAYGRGAQDVLLYRDTGLGKTVAVEQALHLLPGRVPVWRAVAGVAPGLPQLRASLCEALGLQSRALPHRAGPASQALMRTLAEPGVLFVDDAQRLTPPLLDDLRHLWDAPRCAAREASALWPAPRRCARACRHGTRSAGLSRLK